MRRIVGIVLILLVVIGSGVAGYYAWNVLRHNSKVDNNAMKFG